MSAISLNFPVIDLAATGANIRRLRQQQGLSVRDLQAFFGFEEPRAIYKWQSGQTLPSVDNLYALSAVLQVPMERILVCAGASPPVEHSERQAAACRPLFLHGLPCGSRGTGGSLGLFGPFCLGTGAPQAGRHSSLHRPFSRRIRRRGRRCWKWGEPEGAFWGNERRCEGRCTLRMALSEAFRVQIGFCTDLKISKYIERKPKFPNRQSGSCTAL